MCVRPQKRMWDIGRRQTEGTDHTPNSQCVDYWYKGEKCLSALMIINVVWKDTYIYMYMYIYARTKHTLVYTASIFWYLKIISVEIRRIGKENSGSVQEIEKADFLVRFSSKQFSMNVTFIYPGSGPMDRPIRKKSIFGLIQLKLLPSSIR